MLEIALARPDSPRRMDAEARARREPHAAKSSTQRWRPDAETRPRCSATPPTRRAVPLLKSRSRRRQPDDPRRCRAHAVRGARPHASRRRGDPPARGQQRSSPPISSAIATTALPACSMPTLKADIAQLFPAPAAHGGQTLAADRGPRENQGRRRARQAGLRARESSLHHLPSRRPRASTSRPALSRDRHEAAARKRIFDAIINPNASISMGFETTHAHDERRQLGHRHRAQRDEGRTRPRAARRRRRTNSKRATSPSAKNCRPP